MQAYDIYRTMVC